MFTLQGRTAVMSGATGFHGSGVVRALVAGGMNVVMVTHNPDQARILIESLGENKIHCIALSNTGGDAAAIDKAYELFGSVDVIIPNHGGPAGCRPLKEIAEEDMARKFAHLVIGSWKMVQKAIPYLEKSKAGRIILMSSVGARNGMVDDGLCDTVAKGSMIAMTYNLARELAPKGITVNCIVKGGLADDHPPRHPGEFTAADMIGKIPLGRNGTPEEFGAAAAWLACEEAGFVTGQVLNLCGGMFMG